MSLEIHVSAADRRNALDYFESKAARPEFYAQRAEHPRRDQHVGRDVAVRGGNRRVKEITPALLIDLKRSREQAGLSWNQLAARFGMGRRRVEEILRAEGIN